MPRVYGKQSTRRIDATAARCFASSSSTPSSQPSSRKPREQKASSPLKTEAKCSAKTTVSETESLQSSPPPQCADEEASVEDLSRKFAARMRIDDPSEKASHSPSERTRASRRRAPLRETSVNFSPAAVRGAKKQENTGKNPAQREPVKELSRRHAPATKPKRGPRGATPATPGEDGQIVSPHVSRRRSSLQHDVQEQQSSLLAEVPHTTSPVLTPRAERRQLRSATVKKPLPENSTPAAPKTRPGRTTITTITPQEDDALESSHISSLLSLVTNPHDRTAAKSWDTISQNAEQHLQITKIAEASFGEVYRASQRHDVSGEERDSVIKLIPIKPPSLTHSPTTGKSWTTKQRKAIKQMSAPDIIASEIRLIRRMSRWTGYAALRDVFIMKGDLPRAFRSAWSSFNARTPSEFPDPSDSKSGLLGTEQLYAILEMEDAGSPLEDEPIPDIWTLWDVFWSVACSLCRGEYHAQFEHRDLHLGNICIRRSEVPPVLDVGRKMGFTGVDCTIIDYTLSRANLSRRAGEEKEVDVAFYDLNADKDIFEGDEDVDWQYEIYRNMRGVMRSGDPTDTASKPSTKASRGRAKMQKSAAPSPWKAFMPLTNVLWLHYILNKLVEKLPAWPSEQPGLKNHKRAVEIEGHVRALVEMLEVEKLVDRGLGSTERLVNFAVCRGWIDEGHVTGKDDGEGEVVA